MVSDGGRQRQKVGICLSGGGIRAAAFGLGALEAIEERTGLVQGGPPNGRDHRPNGSARPADYLVAVSGGSYIAGAISMLRSRFERKDAKRAENEDPDPEHPRVFDPGTDEVEFVRRRAQYLLRSFGGVIELVTQFLVRLLLNVAFVALPFAVLGRLTGWFYGWRIDNFPRPGVGAYLLVLWAGVGLVGLGLLGTTVFVFVRSVRANEAWRRRIAWLIVIGLVVLFVALVPAIVSWFADKPHQDNTSPAESDAGLIATIAAIGTVVTAAAALLTKAQPAIAAFGRFPKLRAFARKAGRALVALAAAVVAPIALLTLYIWMVQQGAGNSPTSLDAWPEVALVCGGIALFGLIAFLAEPTAWSLHQFYKRALMSCFCIGWQPKDGLAVSDRDYAPAYVWSGWKLPERPELIIAAAATISTYGAAPAGENVLPFVLSKREMGFSNGWRPGENVTAVERKPGVGARFDTGALIDACRNGKRGWRPWRNGARNLPNLTLPASVAITGAAVSPSMGKRTIPPIRMLLALFNLRLGVWLPNPENDTIREAVIDKKEFRCAPAALHTLREYVGRNKRDGKFVYVSDGGHYENLGLVETLRRGCTTVYCIDASGDPPGDPRTLTEAMRLAEAELDISWDRNSSKALAQLGLRSDQSKSTTKAEGDKADSRGQSPPRVTQTWTTLEFHNKAKRPGRVHVIKTGISETTPEHLRAYQNWRPTFPYDGTGNQLFRADRFDAYRELGYHSATTALKAIKARSTQRASAAKKPVSRTRSVVQGRHTAAPPRSKSPGH